MVMIKSIAGTAGALTLALLLVGGCSRDDDKAGSTALPAGSTPLSTDGPISASSAPPPAPVDAPPGATPTTTTTTGAPAPIGEGVPQGPDNKPQPPASRPANLKFPEPAEMRVGWLNATVTTGGSGPCYSLKSTDGDTWAVYSKTSVPLDKGDQVRARITPGKTAVSCGSGKPATLVRVLVNPR